MPVAQAEAVLHGHAQDERVKIKMLLNHIEIISHGVGLFDGIMDHKHGTREKFPRVKFLEVVELPLLVGIHKDKIKGLLDL